MGILYIVATPIGNLKDITLRALEVIKGADLVLCEDTRQTIKLLNHYQIQKPLVSYFQHSKLGKVEYIVEQLAQGKKVALVTDAGTPGISDPGGKLIAELLKLFPERSTAELKDNNVSKFYPSTSFNSELDSRSSGNKISELKIVPIPGPNAAIAALSVCGFPADKFVFMGFPPHKKGRSKFFDEVAAAKHAVVFYESPHRILKTLKELSLRQNVIASEAKQSRVLTADSEINTGSPRASGARDDATQIVVCRELTKMFESVYRGSPEEILKILESDKNNLKGEFVIVANHG